MHRQTDTKAEEKISIPPLSWRAWQRVSLLLLSNTNLQKMIRWPRGLFLLHSVLSLLNAHNNLPPFVTSAESKFCHPPLVHHKLTWTTHVEKGYRRPANPRTPMDIPKNSTLTITCDWRGRAAITPAPSSPKPDCSLQSNRFRSSREKLRDAVRAVTFSWNWNNWNEGKRRRDRNLCVERRQVFPNSLVCLGGFVWLVTKWCGDLCPRNDVHCDSLGVSSCSASFSCHMQAE